MTCNQIRDKLSNCNKLNYGQHNLMIHIQSAIMDMKESGLLWLIWLSNSKWKQNKMTKHCHQDNLIACSLAIVINLIEQDNLMVS